jgi:fatty-acyl-CoA synthase
MSLTPTGNASLPRLAGDFDSLTEALDYAARGETGLNFHSGRGALELALPYRELRDRSLDAGRRLLSTGLKHGDRVAVIAETGPDFLSVFFGCQYAGLIPCPLPHTVYVGGKEAYIARVAAMLRAAKASALIGTSDLTGLLRESSEGAGAFVLTHEDLMALPATGALAPFGPDDPAYIQYSSGSTSAPKGILITQRSVTTNARCILRHGLVQRADDRGFCWLPLYHDMGLVGFCIAPMAGQGSVDYLATSSFARRPALWLKLMSENGTTITYAPTFGYDLAAQRIGADARDLDLSALRVAGIGGDMLRADRLAAFAEALAPAGFAPAAFLPSYGLAEATLAVSFGDLESEMEVDVIDREHFGSAGVALPVPHETTPGHEATPGHETKPGPETRPGPLRTMSFVCCGTPLPGHDLVIVDAQGSALPDRVVGRVHVRGPSLMAGYYGRPEESAAVMQPDGFMDTGDLGYRVKDRLFVTGRSKDMILHNGRNIWPQDVEWAVERVGLLGTGDAAAFAMDVGGREEITVLVHCRTSVEAERSVLRQAVADAVSATTGTPCVVHLVPPRSLPFTSSGKLSRAEAKRRFLSGEIQPL